MEYILTEEEYNDLRSKAEKFEKIQSCIFDNVKKEIFEKELKMSNGNSVLVQDCKVFSFDESTFMSIMEELGIYGINMEAH